MSEEPFTTKPIFLFQFPFKDLLLSYMNRGKPRPIFNAFSQSDTQIVYDVTTGRKERQRKTNIPELAERLTYPVE